MLPVVVVFVLTYALIAARRVALLPIGRPAAALAGACAMVGLGIVDPRFGLSPSEGFAAVEPNTIGLLFGMMLLAGALADAGFFEHAAAWVAKRRPSPVGLLYLVTLGAGLLSAFLVNDSVCVMLAPLVDRVARRAGLDRVPYLLAVAMGANAGSAATLAGNPQNMLVAHLSGISYRRYLFEAGPAALLALIVTAAVLHLVLRGRLSAPAPLADSGNAELAAEGDRRRGMWSPLGAIALVSLVFLAGGNLAWTALAGASLAVLLRGRDPAPLFAQVSWTVLVFFAALFIVVAGLQKTGLPEEALKAALPYLPAGRVGGVAWLTALLVPGCQIVSNVPLILLAEPWIRTLPDPHLAWTATALVTTLAGNLTLLGSVANIIVVERASAEHEIGFRTYAKVGLPVTVASVIAALAWLLLVTS